jgi:hypothetical protein
MMGMGPFELLMLVVVGGGFFGLALYLIGLVVYHSWRRGYNPVVWGLAAIVALNPIFLLVLLGTVPHRRRLRLRAQIADALDAKLAKVGWRAGTAGDRPATAETRAAGPDVRPTDATQTYLNPSE